MSSTRLAGDLMCKEQAVLDILQKSSFNPKRGAQNISIPCPLAPYTPLHRSNRDSRPSMGIKITDTAVLVHCFTCGFKSGQLSYLYSRLAHHDVSWEPALQAVRSMEAQYLSNGLEALRSIGYMKKQEEKETPLDEALFAPYANKFAPYLMRRGITLDTAKRWGVGVDEERKRAVIPVRDKDGLLWGAVGRTYVEEKPKYLNYWEMKKGRHILGHHLVENSSTTVIVEGSIDALLADQAIQQAGYGEDYNVICILGSSVSDIQVQKIISCSHEVIIALDADDAGMKGTKAAIQSFSKRIMTRVADISSVGQNDFGSCSPEQIGYVIENAILT